MKTAISMPDRVFDDAEKLAERLGVSRSKLYTKAVDAYVKKHKRTKITEALNAVYSKHSSRLDPLLEKMQFFSLQKEEW